jgi:hypothetical protein
MINYQDVARPLIMHGAFPYTYFAYLHLQPFLGRPHQALATSLKSPVFHSNLILPLIPIPPAPSRHSFPKFHAPALHPTPATYQPRLLLQTPGIVRVPLSCKVRENYNRLCIVGWMLCEGGRDASQQRVVKQDERRIG